MEGAGTPAAADMTQPVIHGGRATKRPTEEDPAKKRGGGESMQQQRTSLLHEAVREVLAHIAHRPRLLRRVVSGGDGKDAQRWRLNESRDDRTWTRRSKRNEHRRRRRTTQRTGSCRDYSSSFSTSSGRRKGCKWDCPRLKHRVKCDPFDRREVSAPEELGPFCAAVVAGLTRKGGVTSGGGKWMSAGCSGGGEDKALSV